MVDRAIKARDLCGSCYDRLWRKGVLPARTTAATQVLEILELDGGWLTEPAIHLGTVNLSEEAVHKALYRLRNAGKVKSRLRDENAGRFPANEWSTA